MDFPSARVVFFCFLLAYLILQLFLLFRVRGYLNRRLNSPARAALFSRLAALFFLLTFYPVFWHALIGFRVYEPYAVVMRGLLAVWIVGSTGTALMLLAADIVRRARAFFPRRGGEVDLGRRDFIRVGAGAALAFPFVVSGHGASFGHKRFRIEDFRLPVPGISSGLNHLSIVHLTDIHVGPFMPAEELAAYVEAVNGLRPDIIALTGDFVSSRADEARPCVETLARLEARRGIFACLGNHDFYADAEGELTRLFAAHGIAVLRNEATALEIPNGAISVLGIDDLRAGDPDIERAVAAARRAPGEIRVLLSHRPEIFPRAAARGIEVVLAGHYHGGQIKLWPDPSGLSIARLITPYQEGLFSLPATAPKSGRSLLFVGRGVGITGLPIRVNCPPQIARLELVGI
jgi:hypothetical protein